MKSIITLFVLLCGMSIAALAQSNQPATSTVAVERVQPEMVADEAPAAVKKSCCASQATATAGCADKSTAAAATPATAAEAPATTATTPVAEAPKPGCGSATQAAGSGCCASRGAMRAGGNQPR